jgi:crotonobetainyl-CoA:carnitine CoA-transferase CaiB-like acyl-CoA transferase
VTATATAPGPLDGVRVLDLSSVVMGPYATQLLGDFGADVILVEGGHVDINRLMTAGPHPQLSGVALNLLRNKRSVALDLKTPEGREACLKIAATCDVLVTNLRPGSLARAGLTYDDVVARCPAIIYCEAHGFRSDSARADEPAYDDVIQAASGIADAARLQGGEPALAPTILADKVCALTIASSIGTALFRRERTGQGTHIEVPMLDVTQSFVLVEHGAAAVPEPPLGPAGYPRILVRNRKPQRTSDGWIHVLPYTRRQYEALFAEAGRSELLDDPRFATPRARIDHADRLYELVAQIMATRTTAEWLRACRELGVPAVEMASLQELVDQLPLELHPLTGAYRVVPPPVRFDSTTVGVRRPAPLIGEHTDEVLAAVGYDEEGIAELRQAGVIPAPPPERV